MCVSRRSEGQCESKATQNKDKMQEKEDTGENRDATWAKALSGAVRREGVKRGAVGGIWGVCLRGTEMLRAFCMFAFDRMLVSSVSSQTIHRHSKGEGCLFRTDSCYIIRDMNCHYSLPSDARKVR